MEGAEVPRCPDQAARTNSAAQMLGLRSRRRPIGYWDSPENLDEVMPVHAYLQPLHAWGSPLCALVGIACRLYTHWGQLPCLMAHRMQASRQDVHP